MSDFNWKTWAWKGLKKGALISALTFGTFMLDYTKTTAFPPEYVAYVGIAVLVLELILNAAKHSLPAGSRLAQL